MPASRVGMLCAIVLAGCTTPANFDERFPIKPILPVPDIHQYYTPLHKDQYSALILYRDALLAYSKYLNSYIDQMSIDGRLPIMRMEVTDCIRAYRVMPVYKLREIPDVGKLSDSDLRDQLIDYIEGLHRDHGKYETQLRDRQVSIEKHCR